MLGLFSDLNLQLVFIVISGSGFFFIVILIVVRVIGGGVVHQEHLVDFVALLEQDVFEDENGRLELP